MTKCLVKYLNYIHKCFPHRLTPITGVLFTKVKIKKPLTLHQLNLSKRRTNIKGLKWSQNESPRVVTFFMYEETLYLDNVHNNLPN